jgi:hypothetical protein
MFAEIDRVLSKAPILERALGRFFTVLILLYAMWAVRPRAGFASLAVAISVAVHLWWSK